jgi:hypothetical protein
LENKPNKRQTEQQTLNKVEYVVQLNEKMALMMEAAVFSQRELIYNRTKWFCNSALLKKREIAAMA